MFSLFDALIASKIKKFIRNFRKEFPYQLGNVHFVNETN